MDSIVDLLKQDLAAVAQEEDVYIPVEGYEKTGLAIHYRYPESGKELDNIAQKIMRETKDQYYRGLNSALDTMILLCEGVYVRPEGVEEYVQLDPSETGAALKLNDPGFAALLGLEDGTPVRQVIKKLFGDNDLKVLAHADKLSRWIRNTKANLDTEFWGNLGEA